MGEAEFSRYRYDYEVLFDTSLDQVKLWPRTRALLQRLIAYRPDVLNLTGYYDPAQWVLLAYARWKGIKVIISNESNLRDHPRKGLKERFKSWLIRQADGFFCFGRSSAAYLEYLGVSPNKILTQKAAVVDDEVLRQHYQKAIAERNHRKQTKGWPAYNFIFVGRLIPPKNLKMLIEAFAALQSSDWGLVLLGEGEQKAELQALVKAQNVQNVFFASGVPWYEVAEYLALADVLVLPSDSEPWGLVVNEAMICGLPVLVSQNCGCVEDLVQEGRNGFTFSPTNCEELVEKMRFFIQNPSHLSSMGSVSHQIVKAFDAERVAHEMLKGIKTLA